MYGPRSVEQMPPVSQDDQHRVAHVLAHLEIDMPVAGRLRAIPIDLVTDCVLQEIAESGSAVTSESVRWALMAIATRNFLSAPVTVPSMSPPQPL